MLEIPNTGIKNDKRLCAEGLHIITVGAKLCLLTCYRCSLVPRLSLCANVLQAMESWAGPGNEATIVVHNRSVHIPLTSCRIYSNIYGLGNIQCIRYHTAVDSSYSTSPAMHKYLHLTSGSVHLPLCSRTGNPSSIGEEPIPYGRMPAANSSVSQTSQGLIPFANILKSHNTIVLVYCTIEREPDVTFTWKGKDTDVKNLHVSYQRHTLHTSTCKQYFQNKQTVPLAVLNFRTKWMYHGGWVLTYTWTHFKYSNETKWSQLSVQKQDSHQTQKHAFIPSTKLLWLHFHRVSVCEVRLLQYSVQMC